MQSWLVWLVFAIACVLLVFVGYHFSVRTLRFVTAFFALAVVVVVTRYGVAHHGTGAHADLVNAFTHGFDTLSNAFFQPLLGNNNPIPGRLGWLVILGLLVFGYRELEVWAMHWEAPTVDLSALGGEKSNTQDDSAAGKQGKATTDPRHDAVANELRFRLPAVSVRVPAVLPGGTKVAGFVSIADSTGNPAGGLAGAVIDFVGALWPTPPQYRVRIRVEPSDDKHQATEGVRVTVDLENSRTGESVAPKTLVAPQLVDAGCVVAGYVARQIFSADPTAPPWCYGALDGSDLAALLAWQVRACPGAPRAARSTQLDKLEKAASNILCAGITRYEVAQIHDLDGHHVEALRLHALNREQYPRFYRGRYRLGMSLEMAANPRFLLHKNDRETLCECLEILDRCDLTRRSKGRDGEMKHIEPGKPLPPSLRTELLHAAQTELRAVRQQLVSWRLIWKAFVHRDERAILKHYWGLAERERFHDGARVAELLVAVRQRLNEKECTGARSSQGPSAAAWDGHASAGQGQPGGGRLDNVGYLRRVGDKYNLARATWITTAITGDRDTIKAVLKSHGHPRPDEDAQPRPDAQRTRWVLLQRSTPSWQAAYNTACLYAALAGKYSEKKMTQRVVTSLRRAINDPHCELGREWANEDPDFSSVRSEKQFKTFFADPSEMDHPQVKPVQAHH